MGRRSIKEHRRKEMLEVLYKLVADDGLDSMSIGKLASEMDCNPSLIIHYFNTREGLVFALVEHTLEIFARVFEFDESKVNAQKDFQLILNSLFSLDQEDAFDPAVYYNCFALSFSSGSIKRKFDLSHQKAVHNLHHLLKLCKAKGIIDVPKIRQKAEILFTLILGFCMQDVFISKEDHMNKQKEYLKLIEVMLGFK